MINIAYFKKSFYTIIGFLFCFTTLAQLPNPAIVGYWENWTGSRSIKLKDIDPRYNVVCVAFGHHDTKTDYNIILNMPAGYNKATYKSEIKGLQAEGRKVILSLGGQNHPTVLDSVAEKDIFVSSVNALIDEYGFDGVDIDFEGKSLKFSNITIGSPGDERQQLMITAIQEILANHKTKHDKKLLLLMAPEVIYVQGGLSNWGVNNAYGGAYLPIIEALKDDIDMLNVQLYNTGEAFGIDGRIYDQSYPDFLVAMTEAVIQGFTGKSKLGKFSGLPASKVGIGLPGCEGWGYTTPSDITSAVNYLTGKGSQPGRYKLKNESGYPDLGGMMVWSINSDKSCNPSYDYVYTWETLFSTSPYIRAKNKEDIFEQQENNKLFEVHVKNDKLVNPIDQTKWTIENLPAGTSVSKIERINDTIAHVTLTGTSDAVYKTYVRNISVTVDSSQLITSTKSLIDDRGLVLKKNPSKIPGIFEAESFDKERGMSFSDNNNLVRTKNTSNLNDNRAGSYWIDYQIDVTETDTFSVILNLRTRSSGTFSFSIDGEQVTSQKVKSTNDQMTPITLDKSINLTKGAHTLRISINTGLYYLDNIEFKKFVASSTVDIIGHEQALFYPNPVKDYIYLNNIINGKVNIYSLTGQNVISNIVVEENGSIDLSYLEDGIYFIQFSTSNEQVIYQKFIKE